jgi:hypothetical protein
MEVTNHESAKWLSIHATESSDKHRKEVYITLDRAQAIALRNHLNEKFKGEV